MKNLLVLLLTVVLSFPVLGQEPDRKLSDYEKYRMEKESKESEEYPEEEICWNVVEEMPRFNGGEPAEFKKWIELNIEYPKQAREERIRGKVFVKFVVNKHGDVVNVEVTKSVDPILDAEAIRVVKASPKWYPGFQRGNPVNVEFTFPIKFVLKDDIPDGPAVVNNYYNYDYDYGFRHRVYFDTWHYRPYHYSYYDPFYYNNYWGYNPYYYGGYYSYWGYNPYYGGYYGYHHHYNHGYYSRPRGKYYASTGSLGWKRDYYRPYNKTYGNGYVSNTSTKKSPYNAYTRSTVTSKPTANINRKSEPVQRLNKNTYTPRYDKPRTTSKPSYNKPLRTTRATSNDTRSRSVQQSTRSSYNRPATSKSRSSSSYNRPVTNSRSTYSRPTSRSSSSSYNRSSSSRSSYTRSSPPSRSSYSRSGSSSSGRSYSSGSTSRGSGSRSGGKK